VERDASQVLGAFTGTLLATLQDLQKMAILAKSPVQSKEVTSKPCLQQGAGHKKEI
jgi:hypothetical protein